MIKGPLADRLEYAVLSIVFRTPSEPKHQDYWGNWETAVRDLVPDFEEGDLKPAFKRLWKRGFLRLTNPGDGRRRAYEYSGNEANDRELFFKGQFLASITDEGRSYWDGIRLDKSDGPIGFHA